MAEWYCEYDFHADHVPQDTFAGKLTQGDVDDLLDDLDLTDKEWWEKNGAA